MNYFYIFNSALIRTLSGFGSVFITYVILSYSNSEVLGNFIFFTSTIMLIGTAIKAGGDKMLVKYVLIGDRKRESSIISRQLLFTLIIIPLLFITIVSLDLSKIEALSLVKNNILYFITGILIIVASYNLSAIYIGIGKANYASMLQIGFIQAILGIFLYLRTEEAIQIDQILFQFLIIYLFLFILLLLRNLLGQNPYHANIKIKFDQKLVDREQLRFFLIGVSSTFFTIYIFSYMGLFADITFIGEFRAIERVAASVAFINVLYIVILPKYFFPKGDTSLENFSVKALKRVFIFSFLYVAVVLSIIYFFYDQILELFKIRNEYLGYLNMMIIAQALHAMAGPCHMILLYSNNEKSLVKIQLGILAMSLFLIPVSFLLYKNEYIFYVYSVMIVIQNISILCLLVYKFTNRMEKQ